MGVSPLCFLGGLPGGRGLGHSGMLIQNVVGLENGVLTLRNRLEETHMRGEVGTFSWLEGDSSDFKRPPLRALNLMCNCSDVPKLVT